MIAKHLPRFLIYTILLVAAFFFLAPLYVMLVTSFKDAAQIRSGNLMSLPTSLNFESWSLAWSSACTGVDCRGLKPYFFNSVIMAVPAVLISTAWGAINGYVLSLWKFKGSEVLFGFMLFGVFMPFQVVLLPMSQVLGFLGLSSSLGGLIAVHCVAGLAGTTLFFRNYYTAIPKELVNAARIDGAGFWRIFWRIVMPLSTPDFDGDTDLAVHQYLERFSVWRGFQRRRQQTHHGRLEQHGQHLQQRQELQRGHGRCRDRGLAHHAGLCLGRSILC